MIMKTLSCANLGQTTCDYVAFGETDEEVVDKMLEHAEMAHPEDLTKVSEDDMRKRMTLEIKST